MKISRRTFAQAIIGAVSSGCILATGIKAEASSYSTAFSFLNSFEDLGRYFDGQNITISMTSNSSYHKLNKYFRVKLQRRNWYGGFDTIGEADFPRQGKGKKTWLNVKPSFYRFVFSKENDGIKITCTNVTMFN